MRFFVYFRAMENYHKLLSDTLSNGEPKTDRTGIGTISTFGTQLRYDLSHGFPLVTTKKIHFKSVVHELLWFLMGETNIKYLNENGVNIWNEWADAAVNLGNIYGKQWVRWEGAQGTVHNQIAEVIHLLKTNPNSRRIMVSAWNVAEVAGMALPPCHVLFQFYVAGNKLSLQMYQRSADMFLGVPFNIASYALLLEMVASVCGFVAHEFIWIGGDTHIYTNHIEQVKTQLSRECLPLPKIGINPSVKDIFAFTYSDIALVGYQHHPAIKAEVAI